MAPIVTLVRHAQALHNIGKQYHGIRDTNLTEFGEAQCGELTKSFPYHKTIELVVCSPLRRTIDTALLSFRDIIARCGKMIALEDLQEIANAAYNIGPNVDILRQEREDEPIDFSHVGNEWNTKEGPFSQETHAVEARATKARHWLRNRPEKHILVVTHGNFIHSLIQDWSDYIPHLGSGLENAEFRSYHFIDDTDMAHLKETAESQARRFGIEKPLSATRPMKLQSAA